MGLNETSGATIKVIQEKVERGRIAIEEKIGQKQKRCRKRNYSGRRATHGLEESLLMKPIRESRRLIVTSDIGRSKKKDHDT